MVGNRNMRCVFDLAYWTTWLSCSSRLLRLHNFFYILLIFLPLANSQLLDNHNFSLESFTYWSAYVKYSYIEPANHSLVVKEKEMGRYGLQSKKKWQEGEVVHVREENTGLNHGCTSYYNQLPANNHNWIALVQRGDCKFQEKVHQAILHGASAVVVYNHVPELDLITMLHNETEIVTVFIGYEDGVLLARLVDRGITVHMNISMGQEVVFSGVPPSSGGPNLLHTGLLLTFVALLIVGLSIVVVYAVRHAKHVHAKHQAQMNSASNDDQFAQNHLLQTFSHSNGSTEMTVETSADVRI